MRESEPLRKTKVFLSYSRQDQQFVRCLAASLDAAGFIADWDDATVDPDNVTAGIAAEDEWWARLQDMISAADVVVFVVSPGSASSPVCDEEIAFARALGKRLLAILRRPIDFRTAPPRLAGLNVKISFVDGDSVYEDSVRALTAALLLDVHWVRRSADLTQEARRWEAAARHHDQLLQGVELQAADAWAARRPVSAPAIPELLLDYLDASREAEERRRAITDAERARFQEIDRMTRQFLQAELEIRESEAPSDHPGVADEQRAQLELIRTLAGVQTRWHPRLPRRVQNTGAREGYAEIFEFPCCGLHVKDWTGDPPSQFRADGCEDIPEAIRYESLKPMNPFQSLVLARYRGLTAHG